MDTLKRLAAAVIFGLLLAFLMWKIMNPSTCGFTVMNAYDTCQIHFNGREAGIFTLHPGGTIYGAPGITLEQLTTRTYIAAIPLAIGCLILLWASVAGPDKKSKATN